MITEPTQTAVPQEIFQNIEAIHAQTEALAKELSQAQDVWKATLASEKEKFDSLISRKELAAGEQDALWAKQCEAIEERLKTMQADFEARLAQSEQSAARALADLDDAWQRDKLEWGPAAQSQWPQERLALETRIQELEAKIARQEQEQAQQSASVPTETVKALELQLVQFQDTVSQLQNRTAQTDDLVNACVQAIDYQISVLEDLIHQQIQPAAGEQG